MEKLKFEELQLSQEILSAIKDMGFEEASPIQTAAIPVLLEKKDIIGQAQTGTGKTAAFAIPVIENLNPDEKGVQAVVLCPTRELVIQVAQEFGKLLKYKDEFRVVPVYGGQQIDRQLKTLKKGVQVVIGTPGRTMDHIRRGSIKMHTVNTIVLDEADEMLDMGFRDDIEVILKDTPEDRQTVLFSATMEKDILRLTKEYQNDAVRVDVTSKKMSAPKIQQVYFEVMSKNKPELLARLIDIHNVKLSLVFCNTKSQVDELVEILKTRGYFADALHGDMNQAQRDKVMRGFRKGTVEILVATDVAGRGIDVNNVEAVFNYDLPRDEEDYVHRIGRTGRAGKTGKAFTFVTGKQVYNLKKIEKLNGFQVQRQAVPSMDELEAVKVNYYAQKVLETLMEGHLSKYINQVEMLMGDDFTSLDVAAVLLKLMLEKENENFDESINFEELEKVSEEKKRRRRRPSQRSFSAGTGNRSGKKRVKQQESEGKKRNFDKNFEKDFKKSDKKKSSKKSTKKANSENPPKKFYEENKDKKKFASKNTEKVSKKPKEKKAKAKKSDPNKGKRRKKASNAKARAQV